MKLFDWLCGGCDSPNRNEAVQYITEEKKQPVVICTEQPKSTGIEQTQINTNKVSNGYSNVQKPVNGFSSTHQNGHIENGHPIANGKPTINGVSKNDTLDSEPFSVPDFKLIEDDVQGYKNLVANVRSIMINRQNQLEQLIERKQLPDEVEQDVRAARGKIIVIVKNNLNTFDKLLLNATDESQQIADLTGFWGLVHKELLDVQKACERVETSRLNQWTYIPRPITPPPPTPSINSRAKTPLKAGQQTPSRTPKTNPNLRAFMAQKRKEMQSNEQLATT